MCHSTQNHFPVSRLALKLNSVRDSVSKILRCPGIPKQVSTAIDGPMWWSASGAPCCTQMSTVSVIIWWPRLSAVYHTDHPTNLIAPETISRSRDMVGAHQNLNGSRDLTMPLSGMVCHPWASSCYHRPTYQIWSLHLQSPLNMKIWKVIQNVEMRWFEVVRVTQGHWKQHQSIEDIRVPTSVPY